MGALDSEHCADIPHQGSEGAPTYFFAARRPTAGCDRTPTECSFELSYTIEYPRNFVNGGRIPDRRGNEFSFPGGAATEPRYRPGLCRLQEQTAGAEPSL